MKTLVDEFIFGKTELETTINEYIKAQAILQTVSNPSGSLLPAGLGLGEPKFLVDGKRFNGAWGRPQRDGPALRAIALITYSNWLIKNGQTKKAREIVWPVISNDLSYVGQYWNSTGFDLWEEVQGSSFFTVQNQHRSLVEGTLLANRLRVTCTGCDQAPQVLCFLQSFWNGKDFFISNINTGIARTGIDANAMLGPISVFDIDAYCNSPTFQPCHPKSLRNFKTFVDTMRETYSINKGIAIGQGVALGRYAEDIYYGGNPWYLITLGGAEFLYDAVAQWRARHELTVDELSLPFFKDIYPAVTVRVYKSGNYNSPFEQIMRATLAYAESFVAVAQKYTPSNGQLDEQYNRDTGVPLSADDLTWSYAAFLSMAERRAGQYPPTWETRRAASPPSTCAGTSTPGVYAPATAAGAPNVTNECQVQVNFNVLASTYFGENIYVLGSDDNLGNYNVANAYPLGAGKYTSEKPLWDGTAFLTAGKTVTYQYVRQENCGQPFIFETRNRTLTVPACGGAAVTTDDTFTGPNGTPGNC